nr:MAG TPA: dUTPase [Herelleviridae sp.]
MIKVRIFNESKFLGSEYLPEYKSLGASGVDLRADIGEDIVLHPMQRMLISTGLRMAIPQNYEAQVRSRSGLIVKNGVIVLSPGTIDSDYRGVIGVPLANLGDEDFVIHKGDRIAQLVFQKVERTWFEGVSSIEALGLTDRGEGGFGHTGVK